MHLGASAWFAHTRGDFPLGMRLRVATRIPDSACAASRSRFPMTGLRLLREAEYGFQCLKKTRNEQRRAFKITAAIGKRCAAAYASRGASPGGGPRSRARALGKHGGSSASASAAIGALHRPAMARVVPLVQQAPSSSGHARPTLSEEPQPAARGPLALRAGKPAKRHVGGRAARLAAIHPASRAPAPRRWRANVHRDPCERRTGDSSGRQKPAGPGR